MSFVVIIPARYASTRFPGKPLAEIAGKPMIAHVCERAAASGAKSVCVATDDERIAYLNSGTLLPLLVVPSILGVMLGSWMGVHILLRTSPIRLRYIVLALLAFAGVRSLLKGLGIWN